MCFILIKKGIAAFMVKDFTNYALEADAAPLICCI